MSLARRGRRVETCRLNPATVVANGEGEPARKDLGARAELAGGDVMVGVNQRGWNDDDRGGGDGAQLRRRCSGEGAHRRRSRGWGEARGEQGSSIEHLGESWGGRKGRSPRQTEAAVERSTATVMLRRSTSAKVLRTSIGESWVMHCCIQLRLKATEEG
jgi:hypothetical protein